MRGKGASGPVEATRRQSTGAQGAPLPFATAISQPSVCWECWGTSLMQNGLSIQNLFLRDVVEDDLPLFFDFQLDPDANHMAAFTARDPTDRAAFVALWNKILADPTTITQTIVCDGQDEGVCQRAWRGDRGVAPGTARERGERRPLIAAMSSHTSCSSGDAGRTAPPHASGSSSLRSSAANRGSVRSESNPGSPV